MVLYIDECMPKFSLRIKHYALFVLRCSIEINRFLFMFLGKRGVLVSSEVNTTIISREYFCVCSFNDYYIPFGFARLFGLVKNGEYKNYSSVSVGLGDIP